MPIKVKAADGKTDIYGMMFRRRTSTPHEEVSDHQPRVSRTAERQHRQPRLHRGARRSSGARRARLHRRHHRRARHAGPLEVVPGRLLRRDGPRQHDPRSDGRHEGPRAPVCVDRHRHGGDVGPLGRRLRHDLGDVPLSRLLQGRDCRVGQPRPAQLRRRLGRALPGAARARTPMAPTTTRSRPTRTWRRTSRASSCSRTARWTTTSRRHRHSSSSTR